MQSGGGVKVVVSGMGGVVGDGAGVAMMLVVVNMQYSYRSRNEGNRGRSQELVAI